MRSFSEMTLSGRSAGPTRRLGRANSKVARQRWLAIASHGRQPGCRPARNVPALASAAIN
jgi:hypothetical protein